MMMAKYRENKTIVWRKKYLNTVREITESVLVYWPSDIGFGFFILLSQEVWGAKLYAGVFSRID